MLSEYHKGHAFSATLSYSLIHRYTQELLSRLLKNFRLQFRRAEAISVLAITCVISATSSLLSWSLVLSPSIHYVAFLHLRHSVSFMWYIVPCLLHVVNHFVSLYVPWCA
ncbi:hypothetical protein [Shigella phage ESh12]|nr:hypothetical protein [Shigella phage ESh12]